MVEDSVALIIRIFLRLFVSGNWSAQSRADGGAATPCDGETDRENGKGLPAGGSVSLHAAPEGQQSW
jgi:hypothetical protein